MSAPFGRVVDRHIKLIRYKSHPIVAEGERLKEPLLHLVSAPKSARNFQASSRRRRSEQRRNGPKKKNNQPKSVEEVLNQSMRRNVLNAVAQWLKGTVLAQMFAKSVVTSGGETLPRITISGHPGSGTSTLVDGICNAKGWSS